MDKLSNTFLGELIEDEGNTMIRLYAPLKIEEKFKYLNLFK
jgi:hypothetical protein